MLTRLRIKNFRSITDQKIDIGPLTILYGPNASGKSSVFYALSAFKNIALNPNQPIDAFFNLGFANLGGFEQVVHDHRSDVAMLFAIEVSHDSSDTRYAVALHKHDGQFSLSIGEPYHKSLNLLVSFPYPGNSQASELLEVDGTSISLTWNGILAHSAAEATSREGPQQRGLELLTLANSPVEELRRLDIVPLKRGFSKPHYGAVSVPPTPMTEDEVATVLAQDPYLKGKVLFWLEQVFNKIFSVDVPLGTAMFYLRTTERPGGMATELVNDGFGVNQTVYLLAKALRQDAALVCIEEPEIHLHPTAQSRLMHVLGKIAKEEGKQFIISTHSEHVVSALLAEVVKGALTTDDICCYLCTKEQGQTKFERQRVNPNGQIEGGLANFVGAELEHLKALLGIEAGAE